MSENFSTVLIEDPRLLVTDQVKYGVIKGGANITQTQYKAISQTNSQIIFNCPVPSENIILDRKILFGSTVTLNFTITDVNNALPMVPGGNVSVPVFQYSKTEALQVFPLQSLMSVMTATINNTSVNINLQDVLPSIMLLNESDELFEYNGTTNTLVDDTWLNYTDGVNSTSNPLSGYQDTDYAMSKIGRGCLPVTIQGINGQPIHTFTANGNALNNDSFVKNQGTTNNVWTFQLVFRVVEPLLLSPWIFGNPKHNSQGIYGLQNLNFQFNVGSTNRVFSSAMAATSYVVGGVTVYPLQYQISLPSTNAFQNTVLYTTYLTPQPSQLLKSRNVVPYYEVPRYLSTSGSNVTIAPSVITPGATVDFTTITGVTLSTGTITSQTLQLNQIPDKLIINVRVPMSQQTCAYSSSFASIYGIQLNFNNQSGLLSTFSQYDLYRISKENGSTQSWPNFCGFSNAWSGLNLQGYYKPVPTTGSLLVLEFGKDIQLPDYYAPGCLGNFNLQFTLQIYNQSLTQPLVNPELVIITLNSGVLVNDRGTSNIYTGLLNREDVLKTSSEQPYTRSDVVRLVGGSVNERLKSAFGHAIHHHHHRHIKGGEMGMATSGGAMGMATSGGAKHHKLKKHIK